MGQGLTLAREDVIFCHGDIGKRTYLVANGELLYRWSPREQRSLHMWSWISEASLWIDWVHVGELRASTESHLMAIDARHFAQILRGHPETWELAREYALEFAKLLSGIQPTERTD